MSAPRQDDRPTTVTPKGIGTPLLVGIAVAAGTLLFVLANAHFLYVAIESQPECVAHLKAGESVPGTGSFSAARPAC